MGDPFDAVTALGVRVVWLDDFAGQVYLCDDLRVLLVDAALDRQAAADAALDLITDPNWQGTTN